MSGFYPCSSSTREEDKKDGTEREEYKQFTCPYHSHLIKLNGKSKLFSRRGNQSSLFDIFNLTKMIPVSGQYSILFLIFCALISCTSSSVVRWNQQDSYFWTDFENHNRVMRRSGNDDRFVNLEFISEPQDLVVPRESSAYFDCQISVPSTNYNTDINWLFNGSPLDLQKSKGRMSIASNGSLIISRVEPIKEKQMNDEGTYQCIVTVEGQQQTMKYVSKKATLAVAGLPRFEQQPADKRVQVGDTVVFACKVQANPPPKIVWYKNEQTLDPQKNPRISLYPITGSLEIRNSQLSDEGEYKCKVTNGDKYRESVKAGLTVTRPEFLAETSEPVLVIEPNGQVRVEGDTAVFECAANGFPEPNLVWLKDRKPVTMDKKTRIAGQGTLIIEGVTVTDIGTYTCRASNSEDTIEASAALQVQVPPTFVTRPLNVVSKETLDVSFECEAEGRPGPAVTWFKNGEVIVPSEYFVIEGSMLRVLGLVKTDQAVYQCLAENGAGSAQASAQLLVETAAAQGSSSTVAPFKPDIVPDQTGQNRPGPPPPSEPLGLTANLIASRYISLRWDPPVTTNGHIQTYSVFYKQTGSDRERVVNSTSSRGRELTVNVLQPDTEYVIRVVAYNANGPGLSSAPITVTTKDEKAVPGMPQNVRGFALSSRSAEIRWDPPSVDANSVLYYRLFYALVSEADTEVNTEDETEIQVTQTFYVLHGLEEYSTYSFRVEAHSQRGAGLPSDRILLRTLSDSPSAPPEEVTVEPMDAQSISVKWSPPPKEEQNGPITGYKIKYKKKERGSRATSVVTDGNKNQYLIDGLRPGTEYNVKISAVTRNGTGPSTKWETASTYDKDKDEDTHPSAVTKLMVQGKARSILVSWLPPLDSGVMIRGYQIGYGINVPDVEKIMVDANTRFYTIENLTPMRNYIISLRAYNKIGAGFPVYETVKTMASPMDSASNERIKLETPVALRALTESASSVRLKWLDRMNEFQSNREVMDGRMYEIRYGLQSGEPRYRYKNSSENSFVLDGLNPYTSYEFSVRVVLGNKESQWSMTTTNRTFSAKPSSAPRDLTAAPSQNQHPLAVQLNWQPPKFANGPIAEYIVFYTSDPDQDDGLWDLEGVRGDRMTTTIKDLLPKTVYYFKIQARNDVGYGPLSPVVTYDANASAGGGGVALGAADGNQMLMVIIIAAIAAIFALLLVIVGFLCRKRCACTGRRERNGYVQGKKVNRGENKPPPDLWINHAHGHGSNSHEYSQGSPAQSMQDLKHMHTLNRGTPPLPPLDEPPRYQSLIAVSGHAMTRSVNEMQMQPVTGTRRVGRAAPMIINTDRYSSEFEGVSNGTLTRSYHQSATSIEVAPISARQRTPQVVYTGPRRDRIEMDITPTPSSNPGMSPGGVSSDGNRTLPINNRHSNPLKSFTAVAAPPPPGPPPPSVGVNASPARATHIVRPVPITGGPSPHRSHVGTTAIGGKPAGIVIGTKVMNARPRLQQHHPSYATGTQSDANAYSSGKDTDNEIQHSYSNEELNVQMENLDHLMEDLKKMSTQEFDLV